MTDTAPLDETALKLGFFLDDWYVDTSTNRLRRGNKEIRLESKLVAVLSYLALHRGELVTRVELEQAVWGKTVVGYDALTSSIAKLRRLLGDNPRQPRYIETISKKGYRLIARVSQAGQHPATPDASLPGMPRQAALRRRFFLARFYWVLLAGVGVLVLAGAFVLEKWNGNAFTTRVMDRPSIAVLPFANLGDDPRQKYFSDGVTADLTTALSKLSGLFVVSHSSAVSIHNQSRDLKKIAASLGVRYVVEGSIRRSGNRLRVNVNLIDASRDVYLWSEKYDREVGDVFEVQDDMSAHIVNALSVQLTEAEKRLTARKYTASLQAYDDFLKGQTLYFRHTNDDNRHARDLYQQAIDRDPSFARAYSAMALTHVAEYRYGWGGSTTGQLDRALQLAAQGVALDPELPQAHWVLGYVSVFRKEYAKAVEAANRAIQLDPNYAESYLTLAICQIHFGKPDDALRLVRKAMLLNPESPVPYTAILGQAYFFLGQYEQTVTVLREALERNVSQSSAHIFLIAALSELGRTDEATWAAHQFRSLEPNFKVDDVNEMLPVQNPLTLGKVKNSLRRAGL